MIEKAKNKKELTETTKASLFRKTSKSHSYKKITASLFSLHLKKVFSAKANQEYPIPLQEIKPAINNLIRND